MLRMLEPEPGRIGRLPSARKRGAGAAAANAGRIRRKLEEAGAWTALSLLLLMLLLPPLEAMMSLWSILGKTSSLSSKALGAERITVSVDLRRAARQAVFLLFASDAGGRQEVGVGRGTPGGLAMMFKKRQVNLSNRAVGGRMSQRYAVLDRLV